MRLKEALPIATILRAPADQGEVYVLPVAADAAQAHEVSQHAGAHQRRTVADAVDPRVIERQVEEDHYLNLNRTWDRCAKTIRR